MATRRPSANVWSPDLLTRASLAWAMLRGKAIGSPADVQALHSVIFDQSSSNKRKSPSGLLAAYSCSPWLRAVVAKMGGGVGATTWHVRAVRDTEDSNGNRSRRPAWVGRYRKLRRIQALSGEQKRKALRELATSDDVEVVTIDDHPFYDTLIPTSGPLAGLNVLGLAQTYCELLGEAVLLKERDSTAANTVIGLWPIPPTWITKYPTIKDDSFTVSSSVISGTFPGEDVIWVKASPNPEDPYSRATGLAGVIGDEIESDEYASKHIKSFFQNRARPDLIITVEGAQEEDRETLDLRWREKLQGFYKAHRPFFTGSEVKVHEIGQTFQSMQLVDLRRFERDIVLNVWGAPPEMFGILEDSNRATIDAADYLFSKWLMTPRQDLWERVLQAGLIEEYDDRLILTYDSHVEEDRQYQLDCAKNLPWAFMVDDIRKMAGLDPIGGVYGRSTKLKLQEQMIELVSENGAGQEPQEPEEPEEPEEPVEEEMLVIVDGEVVEEPALLETGDVETDGPAMVDDPRLGPIPANAKVAADGMEVLELVEKIKPEMRQEFLDAIDRLRGRVDSEALIDAIEAEDSAAAVAALDPEGFSEELVACVLVIRRAVLAAGDHAAEVLDDLIDADVEFPEAQALEWVSQHGADFVGEATKTTVEGIEWAVEWAIKEGTSPADTAAQLEEMLGLTEPQARTLAKYAEEIWSEHGHTAAAAVLIAEFADGLKSGRADLVADCEMPLAGSAAQGELWKYYVAAGMMAGLKEMWFCGAHPCVQICSSMCGVTRNWGELWDTPIGGLEYPQESHPRCQCVAGLVVV